ncbi:MAG: TonB-dependent receptor [Candidatus Competibacter sp.]|nr:TonB-dependent receptor [Candidatus Competibacteraceae bacterium]
MEQSKNPVWSKWLNKGISWFFSGMLVSGLALAESRKLDALKQMSIDDLANLEISIVSGRPERFSDTAAAVFVITAEDVRRSGATTLPEVLRMVPGLAVGRINTSEWGISARGFQSQAANKLLVLVDGRSVYNSLFSGVYWDSQDILLQDVERIEVVRGPGATTWGANAVNGVINIITKRAEDTQGTSLGLVVSDTQSQAIMRQGGRLGEDGAYRVYAKLHRNEPLPSAPGFDENLPLWKGGRAGFRADKASGKDSLMLEGEFFQERNDYFDPGGHYLLGRWEHRNESGSVGTLQAYYYRFDTDTSINHQIDDTIDVEYRWRFTPFDRHTLTTGAGYRWLRSDIDTRGSARIREPVRDDQLFSAFIQDDIRLVDGRVYLTLGTKLEHNDYTGFEIQPNARLRWSPDDGHTVWAAVSRAVRTPSRSEHDMTLDHAAGQVNLPGVGNIPLIVRLFGNRSMVSEELLAYEAGYRWQVSPRLSLDAAIFLNDYDQLRTFELTGQPNLNLFPAPSLLQPATASNKLHGRTHGMELAADFRLRDNWRLQGAYSYVSMNLKADADSTDQGGAQIETGGSPQNQWTLRSEMNLRDDLELDLWLRYVDDIPTFAIDSYLTVDARLGWKLGKRFALSLAGRNLLDSPRLEYKEVAGFSALPRRAQVEREIYLMAEWRF